jgi:hypothetical protein
MKIFKKILKITYLTFAGALVFVASVLIFFNFPLQVPKKNFEMGVTFSSRNATDMGLDWKETYTAILDDLKIRNIRIPVYWDEVEPQDGQYNFSDVDWQLQEAQKRGAKVILVVGQKVPRWPECFIPSWTSNDNPNKLAKLLEFENVVINRYKNDPEIAYWQVENEPFLNFGICPPISGNQLDAEIAMVRSVDKTRPIVVTDSGELSYWIQAAKRADVFGTTMYTNVYSRKIGYWRYPIGPNFFKLKELLIRIFAGQKNVMVVELQGEPWVSGWLATTPLDQQFQSMNAQMLLEHVNFARETGINRIYLWGVEWWYWLKVKQNHPELWDQAKSIMQMSQQYSN